MAEDLHALCVGVSLFVGGWSLRLPPQTSTTDVCWSNRVGARGGSSVTELQMKWSAWDYVEETLVGYVYGCIGYTEAEQAAYDRFGPGNYSLRRYSPIHHWQPSSGCGPPRGTGPAAACSRYPAVSGRSPANTGKL